MPAVAPRTQLNLTSADRIEPNVRWLKINARDLHSPAIFIEAQGTETVPNEL